MKVGKILIFIISIAFALGIIWWLFPSDGVKVTSGFTMRFPSYAAAVADTARRDEPVAESVDTILKRVERNLSAAQQAVAVEPMTTTDINATENAADRSEEIAEGRLLLPGDGRTYFDPVFRSMEKASERGSTVRIMYYGDSQIEMDRITSIFRQKIQERFGGSGPGMVPTIQPIATVSLRQSASGSLSRYTMYGDSTTSRASHRRYGPMCQFSELNGRASVTFRKSNHRYSQQNARSISRVSVLFGKSSADFSVSLNCDTLSTITKTLGFPCDSVELFTWELPCDVEKGVLSMSGKAEIYALAFDGDSGVAVDNDALRGCAGYIFSGIDPAVMRQSFNLLNTKMIVLQFGGNAIGGIYSTKSISNYTDKIMRQVDYFRSVAPQARILFVGPSDMSKSVNGNLVTWPHLEELNDSLRTVCLRGGVAYWDLFNMMGGKNSMPRWVKHNPPLAGPDYIHFTTQGANLVGEVLSKSFLLAYDAYRHRSGIIPSIPAVSSDTLQVQ